MFERPWVEVEEPRPGLRRRDSGIRRLTPEDRPAEALDVEKRAIAAPINPSLVSTAHGEIEHVLLWCPGSGYGNDSVHGDLLRLLPERTAVTVVASPEAAAQLEQTASDVCPHRKVVLVTAPDWVNFTVWAEDAFVVAQDTSDGRHFVVEPESFGRDGDYLLAEMIASDMAMHLTQAPLAFQGGNVLIGDDFVLVGRDYLDESIPVAASAVAGFPLGGTDEEQATFVAALFHRLLDPQRDFHFLASHPAARAEDEVVEVNGEPWLQTISAGRGRHQPIFHIDMFVTLVGRTDEGQPYRVLVGDPGEADRLLGWPSAAHNLQDEFDEVAAQLTSLGFDVTRTPLPYLPAPMRAAKPFKVGGVPVVGEIVWYHTTVNNCLVEISPSSRQVWLPTYGYPPFEELSTIDELFSSLWMSMGFDVHQLGDFHSFARSLGALHCIKKYLRRKAP